MDTIILIGVATVVVALFIGLMMLGVYLRGKPIKHCGGAAFEYKGEKIECSACKGDDKSCQP